MSSIIKTALFGAQAWVDFLIDKQLPVRNSVLRTLQRKLKDRYVTLQELSPLIKSDPVLCLHIVKSAAALHAIKGSAVTGIDHAINSLGLDHLEEIAKSTPVLKLNPSSIAQKMFFRSVADSHHASIQASALQRMRSHLFVEEVNLAALFYDVGRWAIWCAAPIHMGEIFRKIHQEGIEPQQAETDVLGCTIEEISHHLVQNWRLSALAETSLSPEKTPSPVLLKMLHLRALDDPRLANEQLRELNHLAQERYFPVKLANWLADSSSLYGWNHTKTLKVIDIINDFIRTDIDHIRAQIHSHCAQSSHQYHVLGTLSPATEMLFLPSEIKAGYQPSDLEIEKLFPNAPPLYPDEFQEEEEDLSESTVFVEERTESPKISTETTENTQPDSFKNIELYKTTAAKLIKGDAELQDPRSIFVSTLLGLHEGLGLTRVVLYLVQPQKKQLKAALTSGIDHSHPLCRYEAPLGDDSLFKKLIEKPHCVHITAKNREEMLQHLPPDFAPWITNGGCLLMAIFSAKRPIAILHSDMGEEGLPLNDFMQERFRYLCSAATLALTRCSKPRSSD